MRETKKELTEIINVRVTTDFLKVIQEYCDENDLAVSQLGRRALKLYFAKLQQDKVGYNTHD